MKCPGCGCNYYDEDKYCPICEMPNNVLARAAHKFRRAKHEEQYGDFTTTCAHPSDSGSDTRRRKAEQQRAERLSRPAHAPRPAASTAKLATPSVKPKKKSNDGSRIIKIIIGIFVTVNFVLPLLFGLIEEFLYYGFF